MEVIFSIKEIVEAANKLLSFAAERKVIALHGEMGAGKTTLVHAVCDVLGVTDAVGSPTFSIINQYLSQDNKPIYHIDLYRLKDEEEAIQAGVEDALYSGSYCFVEWPEKAPGIFPENTLHLHLSVMNNDTRKLTINP